MSDSPGIAVGRVVRPWGRHGAVVVQPLTHDPERFRALVGVNVVGREESAWRRISAVRIDRDGRPIVTLEGIDSIDRAEALRGTRLEVPASAAQRPDGQAYFNHELAGLEAWTATGTRLGRVIEVLETGATNVLVIRGEGGEVLVPAAAEMVVEVDLSAGRLVVLPVAGLLEVNRPPERNRRDRPADGGAEAVHAR